MTETRLQPGDEHIPVLVDETLEMLALRGGMTVVDATVGSGALAERIAERIGPDGRLIGVDRDPQMLEVAQKRLGGYPGIVLEQSRFSRLREIAAGAGVSGVDAIVLDLGINSIQLGDPGRGFSFQAEEPLDMRMDPGEDRTAGAIVNTASELALTELIGRYGEERFARRIARAIVKARPFRSTAELARVIDQAVPGRGRGRIHAATRTFQALRIVVNDELGELERTLPQATELLSDGGRLAVISFHSLEDRAAKRFLAEGERAGEWRRLTKKPIRPTEAELNRNPRARSAKLRVGERTQTEK